MLGYEPWKLCKSEWLAPGACMPVLGSCKDKIVHCCNGSAVLLAVATPWRSSIWFVPQIVVKSNTLLLLSLKGTGHMTKSSCAVWGNIGHKIAAKMRIGGARRAAQICSGSSSCCLRQAGRHAWLGGYGGGENCSVAINWVIGWEPDFSGAPTAPPSDRYT